MILAPALAAAAEPDAHRSTAAFRTVMPAADHVVASRVAFVADFDGPAIAELTLRGQTVWRAFSLAVETVGTAAWSEVWTGAGLGNTVIDGRGVFGRRVTHALGLRLTLATGDRQEPHGDVAWWGTVWSATYPTNSAMLAYEGATGRFVWHMRAGLAVDCCFSRTQLGTSVATVQPLAPDWFVIGEVELLYDPSPLHFRLLARREFGAHWRVDGGLALPVFGYFDDPSLQVLGQVQHRW